jgi:DNA-binding FrmR family transcriptional regulator
MATVRQARQALVQVGRVLGQITTLQKGLTDMARSLDEILAQVTAQRGQIESLVALTAGIKAQLDAVLAGTLPPEMQAKVDAIFDGVKANSEAVVAAINANDADPNT